jgi:hypothetical protein
MGQADYYKKGDFNRICDRCGVKVKASETRKEWTGWIVCKKDCWEPRHPQEFVRGKRDNQRVQNPRPEPTDNFLEEDEITADDL